MKIDLRASAFFDISAWSFRDFFRGDRTPWSFLGETLKQFFENRETWEIHSEIPAGVHLLGSRIFIGQNCRIEPGAVIIGPALLEDGVTIRSGAYVRENVLLSQNSLVGAHSEVKGSILLPGAKAPHQAYVGDSILGRDVNLGAGTILSNVKNIGREISFRADGELINTGLRKFGAILGDGAKTGCNTVLNPGVLLGPGSITYPNASLRAGYYPPGSLIKVRQQQQIIEKVERFTRG